MAVPDCRPRFRPPIPGYATSAAGCTRCGTSWRKCAVKTDAQAVYLAESGPGASCLCRFPCVLAQPLPRPGTAAGTRPTGVALVLCLPSASVAQIAHRQRGRASHRGGAPPDAAYVVCFVNVECADRIIYSIFQRFNLEWKTRSPSPYLHRRQCDSAPPSFAIFSSRLDLHTCCSLELLPGNWLVLGLDRPSL